MLQRLLISGDREHFSVLEFNACKKELHLLADYAAPPNASWVEPSSVGGGIDRFIGLSEGDETGLLYTFTINHKKKVCTITSCLPTLGAPAHFMEVHNKSALVLATYFGGSIALCPKDLHTGLLKDGAATEIFLDFPYKDGGHGPNLARQRQSHPHQVIKDRKDLLYIPDLGSDCVWIYRQQGYKLEPQGWLQCPPGSGPRHAVINPNGDLMYVIGELSHEVIAFDLTQSMSKSIQPIEGFAPCVIPPTVHLNHRNMMDASEICLHPIFLNVLYVSNRWERHIARREPHLVDVPQTLPSGDAIAIILLSNDGRSVKKLKYIRTGVDVIRGMRLTSDGKYVAVGGQEGGGVEVYEIGGESGDDWALIARSCEGLEAGIKHAVWL